MAPDSTEFIASIQALRSLCMFLNQFSADVAADAFPTPKVLGMDSISAHTKLFTRKADATDGEDLVLPLYMDRKGRMLEGIRRKGFCYTRDNEVEYAEMPGASDSR